MSRTLRPEDHHRVLDLRQKAKVAFPNKVTNHRLKSYNQLTTYSVGSSSAHLRPLERSDPNTAPALIVGAELYSVVDVMGTIIVRVLSLRCTRHTRFTISFTGAVLVNLYAT